jgi:hypothetical protein
MERAGVVDIEITHGDRHVKSLGHQGLGAEIEAGAPCRTGVGRETIAARILDTLLNPVPVDVKQAGIEVQAATEQLVLRAHLEAPDGVWSVGGGRKAAAAR